MTKPAHILIVDDEDSNVDLLSRYITRAGHRVSTAYDGASAIDKTIESRPDLVLLDWMMPEISGIDVLRSIRERHDANALPVIMCTALDEAEHVVAALSEGANDYVAKPINPIILKARVTAQLQRRESTRALGELNERLELLVADRTRELARLSETAIGSKIKTTDDMSNLENILKAVASGNPRALLAVRESASRLLDALYSDKKQQTTGAGIAT